MSGKYASDEHTSDETIVVTEQRAADMPVDDATIVVPQVSVESAVESAVEPGIDDATIVVPQVSVESTVASAVEPDVDDATIVVPQSSFTTDDATVVEARAAAAQDADPTSISLPRPTTGFDPERPIAPAPGMLQWEPPASGERGVMQGLPVSYGARSAEYGLPQLGSDEVQRRLGPAPAGYQVFVRSGRDSLPSLARRDTRRRTATLVGYAGAVLVSVLGLWGLASVAFGW